MNTGARRRFILTASAIYAALSAAWVLLSDGLLSAYADIGSMRWLSSLKGLFFVAISTAAVFLTLRAVPSVGGGVGNLLGAFDGMLDERRRGARWPVYAYALLLSLAALALRHAIGLGFGQRPLLILFMFPIGLSALLGGIGPGLLATAACALGTYLTAFPEVWSGGVLAPNNLLQWSVLIANGLAISLFSELLRGSAARAEFNARLLDGVISGTSDFVFVKDLQGRYLQINKAAAEFLGRPAEAILGRDDGALLPEASARIVQAVDRAVIESASTQTHEETLSMLDGRRRVFLVTKGPIFDRERRVVGLFGISRDITQRAEAALALQASEAALKQAQQLAQIGSWSWDLRSGAHRWSEQIYAIYGRDPALGPAVYPEVQRYFTPQSWTRLAAKVEDAMARGSDYECDAEVVRPDGAHRWISARGHPLRDEHGEIIQLYGTVQDITESKLAALRLQLSEERLHLAMEATSDALWDWDLRSGEVHRSPHYYEITGFSAEDDTHDIEFFKRTVEPDDLARVLAHIDAHRRGETEVIEFDYRLRHRSGAPRWVRSRGRAVERDAQGMALRIVGTLSDITERHRADEDLRLVLSEAGDAIWLADAGGRLSFANPAALRLTGHALDELQQLRIADLLPASAHAELARHLTRLREEHHVRREWQLLRRDGELVNVDLMTERMQDGRYLAIGRDLTETQRAAAELLRRERQLERVIDGSEQGFWDWNLQSNVFQVSARWEAKLGYAPGEMDASVERWAAHVHPDDLPRLNEAMRRHLAGEAPGVEVELRCRGKTGEWHWVLTRGRIVERDEQGQPAMMSGSHTDITDRKLAELAQRDVATVFESSYEGIMVVGPDRLIAKVNPAFTRITGYTAEEAIGRSPKMLASGRQGAAFYAEMWSSVKRLDFWRGELWNRRKNGELYAELLSISAVRNAAGVIQHYIGVFSDISQLKAHEAELARIANYDDLTGAPNRRLLSERLEAALESARLNGSSMAVCYVDLDGFKEVNDTHGHAVGDQLLVQIAARIKAVLRGEDMLARLGGDEFVLLLHKVHQHTHFQPLLERILASINASMSIGDISVRVSASMGVTVFPDDDADADTLLRHADHAMYLAKDAGKNRYQLYDLAQGRQVLARREQQLRLQRALQDGEFVLHYQPKVDLRDGTVMGVEALIRWQHPEQGLLAPAAFLPQLDDLGMEAALGEWVIDAALAQLQRWVAEGLNLSVSVNVSAPHLLSDGFAERLAEALARHGDVPPGRFEIEILETAGLADMDHAVRALTQCRALGVSFALDDFGTGYSSLAYFRRLPVQILKIDQSFVRDMLLDANDLGIVDSVVRLANAFNRPVIAEGVETLMHGAVLLRLGCHLAQGYGIARPMPAEQIGAWVQQWLARGEWRELERLVPVLPEQQELGGSFPHGDMTSRIAPH